MGCDIHPTVQWLQYPQSERFAEEHWSSLSYEPMSWNRDYALFRCLAGVRCWDCDWQKCTHAVVRPRGYPNDFGPGERLQGDLHTPTWLTLAELKEAVAKRDGADPDVYATIAAMEEFERRGFKTRLVLAFDN